MLLQRLVQRAAALDVLLDVEDQLLHRRLFVPDTDDLEGLHQRDAGPEHGRELAAEDRDIQRGRLAAAAQRALLADPGRDDVLAPEVGAHFLFVDREDLAAELVALAVLAFPVELVVFGGDGSSGRRHGVGRPLP
jgi:hypothetical protein